MEASEAFPTPHFPWIQFNSLTDRSPGSPAFAPSHHSRLPRAVFPSHHPPPSPQFADLSFLGFTSLLSRADTRILNGTPFEPARGNRPDSLLKEIDFSVDAAAVTPPLYALSNEPPCFL